MSDVEVGKDVLKKLPKAQTMKELFNLVTSKLNITFNDNAINKS